MYEFFQESNSMDDLMGKIRTLVEDDIEYNEIECKYFKDIFSKENYVLYPIYDIEKKERISFIVISTGIDGKINNILSEGDTLSIDTWYSDLKLYNYEDALNEFTNTIISKDPHFSIYDYFFGKKDYLIKFGCYERLVELGYAKDYFAGRGGPLTPID